MIIGKYSRILLLSLVVVACETDFDPRGPFLDRPVVYCVLTPLNQTHFVRLYSTYDPPDFNPLEHTTGNQITNAVVSIAFDTTMIALRDTVIPRDDISRYIDSVRAFVASPLQVLRGKTYTLTVNTSAYGLLTGVTKIPGTGFIEIDLDSRFALTSPDQAASDIFVYVTPSVFAEGHAVRILVDYELPATNPGVIMTEEVPSIITNYQDCTHYTAEYPTVQRRLLTGGRALWLFPVENYRRTLVKILQENAATMVDFKKIYIQLVQADEHLYKYFNVVNGFQDDFSIRVDQPNYTNIQGGLGVFGSFALDTSVVTTTFLPSFPKLTCSN